MCDPAPSDGRDSSSRSREDERSESSESLRDRHVTLERNRAEALLKQESCVAAAGIAEGGDSQPSVLDIMNMLKSVHGEVQCLEDVADIDPQESNKTLKKLVHVLLEHIEALVSCLDEVRREAENRTAQMQRRLRSSADITRATVVSLCEWGEEFQSLVSRKCNAEEAAHDMKSMVDALKKENHQLRQHNANLCHDIQSLLTIMNEARATGNWVMDCVTFCEISPEEVYGPVCNISAQQTDMVVPDAVIDDNPDVQLENSGLEMAEIGVTEVCPESTMSSERPVITDEELLSLGYLSNGSDSPPRFSTPYSYRSRQQSSASLPMLPLAAQECPGLCNEDDFGQKDHSRGSMGLPWKRRANTVRRCLTFNLSREEPAAPKRQAIKPRSTGPTNTLDTSVVKGIENWTHVTVGIQTGVKVTASSANMHYGPQEFQGVLTQTEAAGKTFGVMGTQTDGEYEEQDDLSTSFPASVSVLEIESTSESSGIGGIAFLSTSASEDLSTSSGFFSPWRSRKRAAEKCSLFNLSRREPGTPDHRRSAQQVDSAVNTEHALDGIDVERSTHVSVSVQTDATILTCCEGAQCHPPELKDDVNQTEASNKTFGVTGTQTDVEWEIFPSTGHQEDRELRSLKERLNLAAEEVQSKNMLTTQLQTHLDSSLKQVEMSVQALQNVERKLQLSREECENVKKQLISTQGQLEDTEKALESEQMANAQSKAEIQNLALTVQHLQAKLVNLKKNGDPSPRESSSGVVPKVHDV